MHTHHAVTAALPFALRDRARRHARRPRLKTIALLAAGLLAASAGAQAHTEIFTTTLLGTNENPANTSPGVGGAVVTLDLDLATLHVAASFANLVGTTTASHIHCCSVAPVNAIVATQTPTFTGFPLGVTS